MLRAIFLPSDNTDNIQKTSFHTHLVDNGTNMDDQKEPCLNLEDLKLNASEKFHSAAFVATV